MHPRGNITIICNIQPPYKPLATQSLAKEEEKSMSPGSAI